MFILYSVLVVNFYPFKSKYSTDSTDVTGIVVGYKIDGDKLTVNLKTEEKIIINYYFETQDEKEYFIKNLRLGDKLKVEGVFKEPDENTIPNLFNYKTYLYRNKIYYIVSATKITKIKNNKSVFYYIKNKMIERIEEIDQTGYLKTFILGNKDDLKVDTLDNYQQNGISHLFSISGMHVSLLIGIIMFLLDKVSYNTKYKYAILNIILIFYLFLTDVSASILRTTVMTIIASLDKCFNLKIKKVDVMLFVLIVVIIINPFIIYQTGFQFSYIISITLVILNKRINQIKSKFRKNLYISFICFLVSFPLCIYYYYQVNLLSIIFNLIVIPIVSIIIFPLSLITFIFPFIYKIFVFSTNLLEYLNLFFANIELGIVVFTKPTLYVIFVYYFIIAVSLYNKKIFGLLIIVMCIHVLYPYLDDSFKFVMLDVGQGDAFFVSFPNNSGNILIDTGGLISYEKDEWQRREKDYSLADNKIIPYLKSIGIKKLDYLILTHGDNDHMGEAINLINNFKVERVIFNNGDYNDLELELIKELEDKKILYYQNIKELNITDNKLYFLNNEVYDNENDNSNVIYIEFKNYKFLLMGDAGVGVEEDLLEKYKLNDVDVLKIGHHGSKTSSSEQFINSINPKYSLISVGKNNRYGHPNKEVLENLGDRTVYRTDQDGSVIFRVKDNKLEIETCIS